MPRTEEQKARIAEKVVTREQVQAAKVQPTSGAVTVYEDDGAYFSTGPTHGVRSLEEGFVSHVQVVPEETKGKVYVVPCGPLDTAAEEFTAASNGTANCSFETGLFKFNIPRRKGMNKVFQAWVEQETEYGPALVVNVAKVTWKRVNHRDTKEEKPKAGASGEQTPE